jgi:hypothetical protein
MVGFPNLLNNAESFISDQMRLLLAKQGSSLPLYLHLVTDYLRLFTLYEQVSCISHCWWPFWVPSLILACLSCLSVVKIKYPDTSSLPREGRLYLALTHGWSLQSIVAGLLKWQELGAPARKKEL